MNETAAKFCEFDEFLAHYAPLTPYGREEKARGTFYSSPQELENIYDLTADFVAFSRNRAALPAVGATSSASGRNKAKADKLAWHLRHIPELPSDGPASGPAGLFLVHRFLSNFKAVARLLPAPLAKKLGFRWNCAELLTLLDRGAQSGAFHIADSFSPVLAKLRRAITDTDRHLSGLRAERLAGIRKRSGLDFGNLDFLVIAEDRARPLCESGCVFTEPYDAGRVTAKPIMTPAWLELSGERERLRAEEGKAEALACAELWAAVAGAGAELEACARAVELCDRAFARARMARELSLSRPELSPADSPIKVSGARFLPLERTLAGYDLPYTPLDFVFDKRLAVIHGSNMGGKTVVLKTVTLLQLAAQSGFFVPAKKYSAPVFAGLAAVWGDPDDKAEGLSAFGLEMEAFNRAWAAAGEPLLLVMDEFARTTNAAEASALISGVLGEAASNRHVHLMLATHFRAALPREAAALRMLGFDTAAFRKQYKGKTTAGLREKLKTINRFMRYGLAADKSGAGPADALNIAAILGVPARIIKAAERSMEEKNAGN
ncbi:MAG: DNA mismatch repair protein MutS domain-containing protein [Elusimicrobia bacterium]|nr:MAG: DNA mismatch repair protein MutS domain-containing protein [Elusimicrobiota bacterium]KAF0158448.1 MAG: DNA mismatch repair protein MutS domain-containing protein [Elusimicrobiota bacterium]